MSIPAGFSVSRVIDPCAAVEISLSRSRPAAYHPRTMTRPQIERSIKLFIVLLIIAFAAAAGNVMKMLGIL